MEISYSAIMFHFACVFIYSFLAHHHKISRAFYNYCSPNFISVESLLYFFSISRVADYTVRENSTWGVPFVYLNQIMEWKQEGTWGFLSCNFRWYQELVLILSISLITISVIKTDAKSNQLNNSLPLLIVLFLSFI